MTTYLKRFYFDDRKLRERALVELVHAFETGRMIAFVGSMATESLGYGGWQGLVDEYIDTALELAGEIEKPGSWDPRRRAAVEAVVKVAKNSGGAFIDRQVAMTTVHEALAFLDAVDPINPGTRVELLEAKAAGLFGARKSGRPTPPPQDQVVRALVEDLRIRRFATLNYDLEIEAALMVDGDAPADDPLAAVEALCRSGEIRRDPNLSRLSRLRLNGLSVESDIRDRKRPDRLLNFAVGSPEIDYGIMHLHGRADLPKTMVVGLRDYDELYRKNNRAKAPFELGQRVLFGGNPLLFVGAGMTEPEVNMTLQSFVSNSPYRRFAPIFLLWSTTAFSPKDKERPDQIWLKRIDFFRRLGVLTIFDEDLRPDDSVAPAGMGDEFSENYHKAWRQLQRLLNLARLRHERLTKAKGEKAKAGKVMAEKAREVALLAGKTRKLDLKVLGRTTSLIGIASSVRDRSLRSWGPPWRSLAKRFDAVLRDGHGHGKPIALWGTKRPKFSAGFEVKPLFATTTAGVDSGIDFRHRVIIGPPGAGKGALAWEIATAANLPGGFQARPHRRLIINAGFALDTDFLLLGISRFLLTRSGIPWDDAPRISREEQFDCTDAFEVRSEPALIVINGMDRFFSAAGAPLSAELDHLLRRIVDDRTGNVRWLFIGGRRIERYFKFLSEPAVIPFEKVCPREVAKAIATEARPSAPARPKRRLRDISAKREHAASVYFDQLIIELNKFAVRKRKQPIVLPDAGDQIVLEAQKMGDPRLVSRGVVSTYVNAKVFERAGFTDSLLAMEILRAMAFIGTPVEAVVLLHVPRVRARLRERREKEGLDEVKCLRTVLHELKRVHLLMEISHFEEYPRAGRRMWQRLGLHTAVSSELRHQFGVPISESKLSTSFNMSLFVAQPVDGFTPEAAIHEELGNLIDHLIGAYKDYAHPAERETLNLGPIPEDPSPEDRARFKERARFGPYAAASLRAALAVVRSYYSTTSLLTMDRSHRDPSEDKDGVLLEHAERLETLVRVYRKLNEARLRHKAQGGAEEDLSPDPFYPDDLVWLLNELGVVYLAQGDLYSARRNFDQALKLNSETVEFRSHSHNWRRISLNRVILHIERGGIFEAESLMRMIEASVDGRRGDIPGGGSRFDYIRSRFGEGAPESRSCFDRSVMHEEVLVTALVLGHRALCHHLRGNLLTAEPLYNEAISILRRLGENRGYAFFQRHVSQLHGLLGGEERGEVDLGLAVAAAESVRQMDMAYHARINQADAAWRRSGADLGARRAALRHLADAAAYATLMDLYRIRVEAGIHLASLQLDSGDYESALEHATEAMALAAKHGMTLRKINLRLIIGHILIRRGDRKSGAAMIDGAVEAADRFGYQRGVEAAQKIRVAEELGT